MRYIDLCKKGGDNSSFHTILKYGCGPNFVLNRDEFFKQMIKEQGEVFWFRFWLNFCFQPAYDRLEITQKNNRIIQHLWYENIHENILQVSVETAASFCLDVAVSSILIPKVKPVTHLEGPINNKPIESSPTYLEIRDEIRQVVTEKKLNNNQKEFLFLPHKYFSMAFGVALCEVFCKWLNATDVDSNDVANYWVIPKAYLNAKFIPEHLEKFMACKWKHQLFTLLGVSEDQVPWLSDLLNEMKTFNYQFDYKQQIRTIKLKDSIAEKERKRKTVSCTKSTMKILREKIRKNDEISRFSTSPIESASVIKRMKMYFIKKFHSSNVNRSEASITRSNQL